MSTPGGGSPDHVEPGLGLLLFLPYRALETAVLDELRRHGHDLPLQQARVFQRIDPGGSRMAPLAAAAQVSKQTLGSIVDQLEHRGYVRREADPADGRGRVVVITERGRELLTLSLPVVRRIEAQWRDHLGPARAQALTDALVSLREITDPYAAPSTGD